jgi:hypothetical protein
MRKREDRAESMIYKEFFRQNPLRGTAGDYI